ncbi:MAG: alpha/beta hydrolase [Gemmatimonadota bacterium]
MSAVAVLVVVLGAYLLLAVAAWIASRWLIFPVPPLGYRHEDAPIRIATADGAGLAALYLPVPDAPFTVLFSHGNAEDLGTARAQLDTLRRVGLSVLAYDYRGYGLSTGRPTERGIYRDVEAAYTYLTGPLGVPPDRVILHGRSLGGGPSVYLAARRPAAGLILESTFVSAFRVVTRVPVLPLDRFRNLARLRRLDLPVLVIHGTADIVVPFRQGRRLFGAARGPRHRLWVEGAGHNDVRLAAGGRYEDALRDFVDLLRP